MNNLNYESNVVDSTFCFGMFGITYTRTFSVSLIYLVRGREAIKT